MRFSAYATFAAALLVSDAAACRIPSHKSSKPSYTRSAPSSSSSAAVATTSVAVAATTSSVAATSAYPTTIISVVTSSSSTPVVVSTTSAAATTSSAAATSTSSLTSDQQAALDSQNAARSAVGETALTWDDDLAADAQTWATHLTTVGSLVHASNDDEGENLYEQTGTDSPFANAATMWIAEKSDYNGEAIGEGDFEAYGHYTQIVWKSTTKVGMALATDSSGNTYVVARYSPPGNYEGETPY